MRVVHLIGGRRRSQMVAVAPDLWDTPTTLVVDGERFTRHADSTTFTYDGPAT